jgi:hypothetical protein
MNRFLVPILIVPALVAPAFSEEIKGHKVPITTNVQLANFADDGTYNANVVTTATPCPGVSVYDGKDAGRVKNEDEAKERVKDHLQALYRSIDDQSEHCK